MKSIGSVLVRATWELVESYKRPAEEFYYHRKYHLKTSKVVIGQIDEWSGGSYHAVVLPAECCCMGRWEDTNRSLKSIDEAKAWVKAQLGVKERSQ